MKVSVCANVTYWFETELPDDVAAYDVVEAADEKDPVYHDLCRVLNGNVSSFEGNILSVINDETNDSLFTL